MISLRRPAIASIALAVSIGGATAAELYTGRRLPTLEPRPVGSSYLQPGIWQGLNVGIHAGYNWSRADEIGGLAKVDASGTLAGAHLGYNWQFGRTVLGAEGDVDLTDASGWRRYGASDSIGLHNHWLSTFRLRAGLAFDSVLIYATGGLALGDFDVDLETTMGAWRSSGMKAGWVAGAGIETKLSPNISARLEALYFGFNDASFPMPGDELRADLSATTVRAGLTYHFSSW